MPCILRVAVRCGGNWAELLKAGADGKIGLLRRGKPLIWMYILSKNLTYWSVFYQILKNFLKKDRSFSDCYIFNSFRKFRIGNRSATHFGAIAPIFCHISAISRSCG
ncbi:hypothetical protein [Pseudooceanicola sp. C21-150M6]|uniref:hypothetical protein n=1 Tax=Pseudooceanicola sp. C21-150M6 TaxID=3434355 RepID=UPI003D7F87EB